VDIPSLVAQIALQLGVDPVIAVAQAQVESSFNPNAVSSEGAVGVMQLMPETAAGLGVTNLTDPTQNITGGLTYDLQMLSQFGGDWMKALAAYNWGPGNVQKAVAANGAAWFSSIPSGVQNYVTTILGAEPSLETEASDGSGMPSPSEGTPGWVWIAGAAAFALGVAVVAGG
jgi:soluble lytic murein transglycosylase-like protein